MLEGLRAVHTSGEAFSPSPERFRPTKQVKLDERRLFVGGLPPHVADSQLIERFKRYGQVVEATALAAAHAGIARLHLQRPHAHSPSERRGRC